MSVKLKLRYLGCMIKHFFGANDMSMDIVNVECVIMNGDAEWDYSLRRHHVPSGGSEFFTKMLKEVFNSDLEDGPPGEFTAIAKVNGQEVANLTGLTIDDVRDIEDDLISAYKDLRSIKKKGNPERFKAREERREKKRVVKKARKAKNGKGNK